MYAKLSRDPRRSLGILLAIPALALSIAACGPHGSSKADASAAAASASAFAHSAQGVADKKEADALTKKCLPGSESAQLKLAEPVKGKIAREGVEKCLTATIPAQNKTAFDDALLNAAVKGHLSTKAGRSTFAKATVPGLVEQYSK